MSTNRATIAFHPPLIALFPVLAVFSANTGLFPIRDLRAPVMLAFVAGLIVWLVASAARRSFERGAVLAVVSIVGFWSYQPIFGRFGWPAWVTVVYLLIAVVAGWKASTLARIPTRTLNLFGALLVLVSGSTIAWRSRPDSGWVDSSPISARNRVRPDVFVLLLDGYGRTDQLKRVFGFDNQPFVDALKSRGFFVPTESHSNYCQTALSLSSMLNFDWVQNLVHLAPDERDRTEIDNLVNRPRIVRELRARGYDTVAVSTGFPSFTFEGFDLVVSEPPPVTYFESVLLESTPFKVPGPLIESQYVHRRKILKDAFSTLEAMATPTARPRFVFAHILAPHPPFVFDAKGNSFRYPGVYGFFDGSDFLSLIGPKSTYEKGYVGQVQWVSGQVLKVVDALLAHAKTPPIIVLQGDHGSKLGLDQNELSKTDIQECFGAFGAYHLPEGAPTLPENVTPLAAMRTVFGIASGSPMPPIENRSYYSGFAHPYDFTEVTKRLH